MRDVLRLHSVLRERKRERERERERKTLLTGTSTGRTFAIENFWPSGQMSDMTHIFAKSSLTILTDSSTLEIRKS